MEGATLLRSGLSINVWQLGGTIRSANYELWKRLVEMANKVSDGHLTVMKFKTNWRVGFFTPNERKDLDLMPVSKTFADAARMALGNPAIGPPEIGAEELWPASRPRAPK